MEERDSDERSLRVFEIWRISSGRELAPLEVDLPLVLARRHEKAYVVFMHAEEFGWHAHVTGDDGFLLISFPWTDHVDQILTSADSAELPVNLTGGGWDNLEQHWWGHVAIDGSDVYVAEADLQAIDRVEEPHTIEHAKPGIVLVNGVEVRWNVVSKRSWDEAWRRAVEACRQGNPSPVGDWADESGYRLVIHGAP